MNLSLFTGTKAKSCEDLSNDEMWSLPCFIYPDYKYASCDIFMLRKRHFLAVLFAFLTMNE